MHLAHDAQAMRDGSPEYAGRDAWIQQQWLPHTDIQPLIVVCEEGAYRLWDGYRRLSGAFHYGLEQVAVVMGEPKDA